MNSSLSHLTILYIAYKNNITPHLNQLRVRSSSNEPIDSVSRFFLFMSGLFMHEQFGLQILYTVLCKLVVSLQMQNRKTTDKINEISIVPNPPNYSIVAIADQRTLHLHFATDNQLAKPCTSKRSNIILRPCKGSAVNINTQTPGCSDPSATRALLGA